MIRILNAYFPGRTLLLTASEAVLTCSAFFVAVVVWYGRDFDLVMAYENGFLRIGVVAIVFLVCMYYLDMYDSSVLSNRREVVTRLIQVAGVGSLLLALVYYAFPGVRFNLGIFLIGVFLLTFGIGSWRVTFFWICRSMQLVERTIILGDGNLARELSREIENRPEVGLKVLGYVNPSGEAGDDNFVPHLGGLDRLTSMTKERGVERIVVALGDRRGKLPVEELLALKTEGVKVQDGADLYEALTGKLPLGSLHLSWLLFSPGFRVPSHLLVYKRIFSLVVSSLALVLSAPLMLLIGLLIRLDSPGPIIFRQKRVGHRGKHFTLYKFRSMYHGAENGNTTPAKKDDDRFTRVGRWLRRVRLDELPQLYNILKGDMYFVGPRPFVPEQEEECIQHIPFYTQRWSVRPGATGWAQIHRGYNVSIDDNREKLAYDLFYVKNISVGLDLLVMLATAKILILGRGGQ